MYRHLSISSSVPVYWNMFSEHALTIFHILLMCCNPSIFIFNFIDLSLFLSVSFNSGFANLVKKQHCVSLILHLFSLFPFHWLPPYCFKKYFNFVLLMHVCDSICTCVYKGPKRASDPLDWRSRHLWTVPFASELWSSWLRSKWS